MRPDEMRVQAYIRQFLTFAAVGAVGTALHYATLISLVELTTMAAVRATTIGALLGASVNYALNYRHTFRSQADHRATAPRFLTVAALGFALNAAIVYLGANMIGVHYLLAQVAATATVLIFGFAVNRFWTFGGARGAGY